MKNVHPMGLNLVSVTTSGDGYAIDGYGFEIDGDGYAIDGYDGYGLGDRYPKA